MKEKVLILGSGGLRIGQAGEFDYSGSQAIKALREEGYQTILINPNIATVQTDPDVEKSIYFLPLNLATVSQIIEKERPSAILLGFGGQTALNLGLALEEAGILKKYGVRVLGTSVETIRITEDRKLFKMALDKIGVKTAKSFAAHTVEEAIAAAKEIGFPVMVRSGYSLGGLGSSKVDEETALLKVSKEALAKVPQILIEEYLLGWKEIEYEILRDCADNVVAVCNMENLDPMGVHTGESIVVAPSQTLSNEEYHFLREVAFKTIRHLKVIGECNIQYALHPQTGDYRVIEVNARLSRSSALASKATGYPLAFVAAKLSLGKQLFEVKNSINKKTSAFFEPALDYLVVKIPRWDIQKLKASSRRIGSEMKSVGEVMAIGKTFSEALQKGIRMSGVGASSLFDYPGEIKNPKEEISFPTDRRLFAIAKFLREGGTSREVHELSHIDPWFCSWIADLVNFETTLKEQPLTRELLVEAKKKGFSDLAIAKLKKVEEKEIRNRRLSWGITPVIKQIDTLAGEFEAETNYLYMTYHGKEHDIDSSSERPIAVIGSGPYSIGSSVEFDWCAVNTARTCREHGEKVVIVNCNPETVSTDYDESERLYFEELTFERLADIFDFETPKGIVVSVGGQVANTLALPLHLAGYPILGTSPQSIDRAEDRKKFSTLLHELCVDQPKWIEASSLANAKAFAKEVGYPLLIRPSYVLSGAAMNVIASEEMLEKYLEEASAVSPLHPVVISQYILGAKELEIDAVADKGKIVIEAISEHIENAGVHSGDATIVLPPQRIYLETIRRAKQIMQNIAQALELTGPFNIQFIAKDNALQVIECNVRASRSLPFVSKVTGQNFIEIATRVLLKKYTPKTYNTIDLDFVGVKAPLFSYHRLKGSNPVAHVEMASTGEVASLGSDLFEAFFSSWLATENSIQGKRILVSIGGDKKTKLFDLLRQLDAQGWLLYSTSGTHDYLSRQGVASRCLFKASEEREPNVLSAIADRQVDLIINIPRALTQEAMSDGFLIRRASIDHNIPLVTNLQVADLLLSCLLDPKLGKRPARSWQEYQARSL